MPHKIQITLPDSVLDALADHGEVNLSVEAGADPAPARKSQLRKSPSKHGRVARAGSLPQRIKEWGAAHGTTFGPTEVMAEFSVSRPHASMLLTTLVKRGAIRRVGRGAYEA